MGFILIVMVMFFLGVFIGWIGTEQKYNKFKD